MARDTERNVYLTVSIPKSSLLFTLLQADAEATGINPGHILVLRAADWYQLAHHPAKLGAQVEGTEDSANHHHQEDRPITAEMTQAQAKEQSLQSKRNAEAALDEWL